MHDLADGGAPALHVPGVLLTGLPSSGKSTLAAATEQALQQRGIDCHVLDGDELRARIPPALGFSHEDRSHQFARALFVAEILSAHRVIPILALVAPFADDRDGARRRFAHAGWIEVFLDPPHDVCLARDSRGLYEKLNAQGGPGLIEAEVTGLYEPPRAPTLRIDTARVDVERATAAVLERLGV
ncbi:MAG TPA: adenylyl-sulfate kinase [Solirubrobacteraceae bacterium]